MNRNINYLIFFTGILAAAMQSCTTSVVPVKEEKFLVTDALIKQLLIDTVSQANNLSHKDFSAIINADEEKLVEIFPMVSGVVSNVNVMLGDRVNKGQLLASMSSAEMAGFDKEAISANAELKNAERNLKVAEDMFKGGLISEKELTEAQNTLKVAKAENKRSLAILKLNGGNTNGTYQIKSPINGFVVEKNITTNLQLRPDHDRSVFTIANLSKVWVLINIYESDISKIEEGSEADIHVLAYPDKIYKGKIDKIYHVMDAESKVVKARIIVDNPDFVLKPGMIATANIGVKAKSSLPVVNAESVIFDQNKNYVLVLEGERNIKIKEVEVAYKAENKAYISKGISIGDQIISSKQVFLYESLKN